MTLREFRKNLNVPQNVLAARADITAPVLCNIEYGRWPTKAQADRLAEALTAIAGKTVTVKRVASMCGGIRGY